MESEEMKDKKLLLWEHPLCNYFQFVAMKMVIRLKSGFATFASRNNYLFERCVSHITCSKNP
ncbi:MAG: hypothetical protein A2Y81_12005 [Nitrospirae bacterium RBG_13_43_8]|nr:MAG: hypothetical protein A2Y81_12005 [Nitrospirae bacterium RBG_13_43_8]